MSSTPNRLRKLALVAGFAGLAVAVLAAHRTPAAGYEISPYAATPRAVWAGVGVALAAGALGALTAPARSRSRDAGVLLVVGSALAVYAMPVIRGYEFYGAGDALSHVGWAREIASGALEPTNLLYPGVHTLTVFVSGVADVPLPLANNYVVLVAFPLVFLLFVPLAAQLLAGTPTAYAVGLLAAVVFVPINNIAVHPIAHPASQAILAFAFLLYLALAYAVGVLDTGAGAEPGGDRAHGSLGRPFSVTGTGGLLALASAAIVLVHPQQALNVALVFVAVSFVQFVGRWYFDDHPVTTHRPLYLHTAVLVGAFALWAPRFERAQGAAQSTIRSILQQGASTGDVVAAKSASLTVVGGSLPEIFLKLFGTATVVSLLAAGLLVVALRRHRRGPDSLVAYVAAGFVPLVAVFAVVLAAEQGDMYFRYQGFIMVPVTVVGAAALARARGWFAGRDHPRAGTAVVAALLLVLVPVGLVAVHPSPYMYQPSQHVTEEQVAGYDAAFEHRDPDVPFTGLRGGPRRFVDYHYGTQQARTTLNFPGYEAGTLPSTFANASYADAYETTRYLVISAAVRETEVELYDGFRYPRRGFELLESTPGVARVRSNGEFRQYVVEGDE
ncbi:hypothetical protein [Halobacterium litoreum]|uniref:Dolichyl-phosphate-mannose-protein mannosyltransferase n=1 Tax=Halobacterium litoreum TaxID=2039234 RepID=A0ABD5NAT4_9EURY|nr:hypothetical protein [Halobacterium litoreum]UHH14665.1 hypothetical protein LT972_06605 [Halobacterium litoreum]